MQWWLLCGLTIPDHSAPRGPLWNCILILFYCWSQIREILSIWRVNLAYWELYHMISNRLPSSFFQSLLKWALQYVSGNLGCNVSNTNVYHWKLFKLIWASIFSCFTKWNRDEMILASSKIKVVWMLFLSPSASSVSSVVPDCHTHSGFHVLLGLFCSGSNSSHVPWHMNILLILESSSQIPVSSKTFLNVCA